MSLSRRGNAPILLSGLLAGVNEKRLVGGFGMPAKCGHGSRRYP